MTMPPLVSVIVPSFNRLALLKRAVQSVFFQTYRDFELLLIDDGSDDGTRGCFERDGRLRYFFQTNSGVSSARNNGIRNARGKWVAFLDSDDYWFPRKLEQQMAYHAAHPEFRVSQTEEAWIRLGRLVNPMLKHRKAAGDFFERSLELCLISPSCVLLEKDLLLETGLFDESFPVCEDYDLWLRMTLRNPVGLVPRKLVVKYGGHEDQLSRRHWGMDRWRIRAIEKILNLPDVPEGKRRACHLELARKCGIYSQGCLKHGREEEALKYRALPGKYSSHEILQA